MVGRQSNLVEVDRGDEIDAGPSQPSDARQLNLLTILWRRHNTIVAVVLLSVTSAFVYLVRATPLYSSTSRICVEQNTPRVLGESMDGGFQKSDAFLYTQSEIVNSLPVLTVALQSPAVSGANMLKGAGNKLSALRGKISVDVGQKDDIISVSCTSPDPKEAALVVNTVVDAYVEYETKQNKGTAGEILKLLTSEKDKHEAILDKQSQAKLAFTQSNGDVFFKTDKGNIVMQEMESISTELTKARLEEASAKALCDSTGETLASRKALFAATAKVQQYEQMYKEAQEKSLALTSRMAQYDKLQSDMDRTTKMTDLLDSRIKELNITEETGPLNIGVLEVARPGEQPTSPKKVQTVAIALIAGLILGVGSALLHETLDQRLRSVEEVAEVLALPVLGIVPSIKTEGTPAGGCQLQSSPQSDVSEAYRSFRTALQFGLPDRNVRTILVTSPTPGDGKSTTASNLAVSLAHTARKTLLLDADLRKPVQHKTFGLTNKVGLSNVLTGAASLEQAIQTTQIENLDLLACGSIPPNPSELINSHAFHTLLKTLSGKYDQIVVDSPPVIPVADSRILGALCDITVMVLRAEKSTRRASRHACELLGNVRARLIGVLVNDVTRSRTSAYGYYYYNGYYNYYSAREPETNGTNGSNGSNGTNGHKALIEKVAD